MSVNEFDDPTGEQLIAWTEDTMGCEHHVIRSHRRPRQSRRGPVSLIVLAAAVAMGITAVAYTAAPADDDAQFTTASQGGEFVPIDDLAARAAREEAASRHERQVIGQRLNAMPENKVKKEKKASPTLRKPRWVNPVAVVKITSCFGARWGSTHKGIDYDGETGDKIRSVGAGTVVQAGWRYNGLGYSVVVRHVGGWMTLYGHLSKVTARPGQKVSAGDLVGLMGSTGHSTGSHLHLGAAKTSSLSNLFNSLVNPASWLRGNGIPAGRCA